MPFYSLRITPEEITKISPPHHFCLLFKDLIVLYALDQYALCIERLNKYLEPCKKHYHFNFTCSTNKETIRAYITRWGTLGQIKGKAAYSLSSYPEPNNEERWWRYCFKEKILKHRGLEEVLDVSNASLLAIDERKSASIYHIKKREMNEQNKTVYQRYEAKLDKSKTPLVDQATIFVEILQFAMLENKSIVHKQILGFTHLYMLKRNLISHLQYYESQRNVQQFQFNLKNLVLKPTNSLQ